MCSGCAFCCLTLGIFTSQVQLFDTFNEKRSNYDDPQVELTRADEYMLAGNFQYINQVVEDWGKSPFVELKVEEKIKGCNDGWEPVFTRIWGGMKPYCKKRISKSYGKGGGETARCEWIDEAGPIAMVNLDSVTICGKRGGESFATA